MICTEILTIGSELLQGSTLNSNAQYLGKQLTDLGFRVEFQTSCSDAIPRITEALELAMNRADLVVATGGLGPTPDDLTREAVAHYFRTDLCFHPKQYRNICKYFKKIKQRNPVITRREAFFPKIATPIQNRAGIALGFYIEHTGKLLLVLPGVPREMMHMFENQVKPILLQKFGHREKWEILTVSLTELGEPQVMKRLRRSFFQNRGFEFGIYPKDGWITIKLRSHDSKLLRILSREIHACLGKAIYAESDEPIEFQVARLLKRNRKTISVAESCTGGLLAKRLTDLPGASHYFVGGVLAYADSVKRDFLSVPREILKKFGAVSKQTAVAMAKGVRLKLKTDLAVSLTGIAGPSGGKRSKPVGTVWIALSDTRRTIAQKHLIGGSRDRIRQVAVLKALRQLYDYFT